MLEPGAEVTVRTPGSAPRTRYFVAADDAAVTLLDVSDPALPPGVAKLLRRTAAKHPDRLAQLQSSGQTTLFLDRQMSVSPSGLFVGATKIGALTQFVERIARADVEGGSVQLQAGSPSDSDVAWSKVRQLAPGTPLTLTTEGGSASARYVLSVDDTTLRVLNTSIPGLSAEAADMLRRLPTTTRSCRRSHAPTSRTASSSSGMRRSRAAWNGQRRSCLPLRFRSRHSSSSGCAACHINDACGSCH